MSKLVSKIRRTNRQAYTNDWETISQAVIARDGGCTKCGLRHGMGVKMRAHHVIPISKGGRTVMYNLKTVCDNCHERMPGHKHLKR